MCGIVGYIGKKQAAPILLEGLRRLEYRGYDSAGICVHEQSGTRCIKSAGKISNLSEKFSNDKLEGNVGIGHTRWATHGAPTDQNAHPHGSCNNEVFVVHNGIVENFTELKNQLEKEGHTFKSETDTEIIAHLVEKFLRDSDLEHAVKNSLKLIKGAYALVVMSSKEPDKLVATRVSSPLRIGVGKDEFIIASDPTAVISYTKDMITLTDNEVAVIDSEGYHISLLNGEKVENKEVEKIEWDLQTAEKGGFDHFMIKEIFEQPHAITDAIRGRVRLDAGHAKLGGVENIKDHLRKIEKIHLVACGTASYAGMVGKMMIEEYAGVQVEVSAASEFRYRKPLLNPEKDIVMVISQSGETADTLAVIKEAKSKGVVTAGIVNVVGSTIARETDAGVYNHAGPEIGVASTKAFVSQLTVLALLTVYLGRMRNMSFTVGTRILEELMELPKKVEEVVKQNDSLKLLAKKYAKYENFFFMGRKYNFPIALEGALKLKEISYVHAEGGSGGELKHGPLALVTPDFPTLFIAPKDSVYEKNFSNIQEVKARDGRVIVVTTEGNQEINTNFGCCTFADFCLSLCLRA
jgi:glutamine---fructose-6-phosphate transaminase (isomerizing)